MEIATAFILKSKGRKKPNLFPFQRAMRGRSVSMETMSRGGVGLPTSLSGGGLAHLNVEVSRSAGN